VSGIQKILLRAQSCRFHRLRDLKHVEAFRDNDCVDINVAASQSSMYLQRIGWMLKQVFSGFECLRLRDVMPQKERRSAANDSRRLEFIGDVTGGVPLSK